MVRKETTAFEVQQTQKGYPRNERKAVRMPREKLLEKSRNDPAPAIGRRFKKCSARQYEGSQKPYFQ